MHPCSRCHSLAVVDIQYDFFGEQALCPACAAAAIGATVQGKLGLNCEEMALLNTPAGDTVVDAVIRRFGLADDYDPTTFTFGETLQAGGILTESEAEWLDEG